MKPLREWTLAEVKSHCSAKRECKGCIFLDDDLCKFRNTACLWSLNEMEANTSGAEDPDKSSKPRLAEVLGVEVGERFRIGDIGCDFWVEQDGWPRSELFDRNASSKWVVNAINYPESIIRAPRLTEAERAICKAVGAKWVSYNEQDGTFFVDLWAKQPTKMPSGVFFDSSPDVRLASVHGSLFPSVHPGDCICVEEAGGE